MDMNEIAGVKFADEAPAAAVETPKADPVAEVQEQAAESVEQAADETPKAKEGEGSDDAEEKPKAWKEKAKGPPETVPYKVLSERTEKFRQREAELVAQVEALRAGKTVPSEQPQQAAPQAEGYTPEDLGMPPEPDASKFETLAEYERAVRSWDREFAKREALAEIQNAETQRTQAAHINEAVQTFDGRLAEAKKADPEIADIESYLEPAAPHLHPMIRQAILQSEAPGAVLRHIAEMGSGLQEIVNRCNSTPVAVLMELGRLGTAQRQDAPERAAPPPIPPTRTVGGGRGLKAPDPVSGVLAKMGARFSD